MNQFDLPIENAIRSLYQMILVVNSETKECRIVDHNEELFTIADTNVYRDFFYRLFVNVHPMDRPAFQTFTDPNLFPKDLATKVHTSIECRIRHTDHRYYWTEIIFCNASREDGIGGPEFLFLLRDIDERKTKEIRLEAEQRAIFKSLQDKYDALFEENMLDQQTGCYNRKGMKYYTDIVIQQARESGDHIFVCVADLNGLKHINDTYGHAAGDEAIAEVSKGLLNAAPTGSRIVRTGGDEFLLLAALAADSKEPEAMGEKLEKALEKYNEEHPNPFTIGASYGWVLLPLKDDMVNVDEYVEIADRKMYEMKVTKDAYRRD